ncbi:MAG: alpha/beta fold hydrolase [Chloroflexi bacterium]|nr:alpha/beta fold hydrolase [Chloroflexota bacterium]
MDIDIELYRREIRVSSEPRVQLSAIDIAPDHPQRTIVFIHGYGGQATQWQYQLCDFSVQNRVIALDLRGHGRSDKPAGPYHMAQIQTDLENALDVLGVAGKFVLVGHSFGGAVAAEYAAAHPNRIEKLVLIATTGEFHLNPLYRFLLRLPVSVLRLLAPIVRDWLSAPPHVMHAWYHTTVLPWNGWSLFRSLTVPTLTIRGSRDLVFDHALFEETSQAIPLAEDVNVGSSGHMVMLERREAVNRAISCSLDERRQSWRDESSSETSARAALVKKRPWLSHYKDNIPFTVAIPQVPLHQLLRSSDRRFPRKTAIIFEGRRISYRRLNQEVNRFANALLALGIVKGDRVMLLLPNLPQIVIGFFGTLKAGAVVVFTLPSTEPEELIRQAGDAGARVVVTLPQFEEVARQAKDQPNTPIQHIIFTSATDYLPLMKRLGVRFSRAKRSEHSLKQPLSDGMHHFDRLLAPQSKLTPEVDVRPGDLASIQYTGGTTAAPKGVMLSHRNLVANALQTRHWIPDAKEGCERFLCAIPISHSYGMTTALNVPIALGATLILKARFEVTDILETIKRYHPTIFPGVPQMYVAIKDKPGVRKYGVSSIRACISGSAPLPMEVQEAFEKLTRGRLVEGYGLTEASPVTHANPLNGLRKVGSIGIPLPSTEARVVGLRHGAKDVPTGQIGELAVRGPQVMLGYWNDPEATDAVLRADGWLLTGDVAQADEEGYVRIIARKADMWYPNKPDQPAFPRDVEEVLFEVPQVKEAAVVAIAGQPIAFVIAKRERPTSQALIAYCKRRLPPELVPRVVIFLDEFPRTFIGKVLRRELAKVFEQTRSDT